MLTAHPTEHCRRRLARQVGRDDRALAFGGDDATVESCPGRALRPAKLHVLDQVVELARHRSLGRKRAVESFVLEVVLVQHESRMRAEGKAAHVAAFHQYQTEA